MQTLLIGDLHACYQELLRLIEAAGLSEADRIIALGDIVDRGPAAEAVIDFFQSRANAFSLRGNHERKHINASKGIVAPARSQTITRQQLGLVYSRAVAFFETLPVYLELPEAVLVHGYLEPDVPLEEQRETVLCGTMGGDAHLAAHYHHPWYEMVALDKPVVCGHRDYRGDGQPFVYQDRVFGLDTSCVIGKRLTGLVLPGFTFLSVPAEKNYWYETRRAFPSLAGSKPVAKRTSRVVQPWDDAGEHLLEKVLAYVREENERVTAQLHADPLYETLPPRQQAKVYAGLVRGSRVEPLLHLQRRSELTLEKARRILQDPAQARELLDDLYR